MSKNIGAMLLIGFIIGIFSLTSGLGQYEQPSSTAVNPDAAPVETMPAETAPSGEPETQWLWGEVASVDAAAGKITVKYLDYDTDTEKQMEIISDAKTTFDNVKGLDEIKPQDTVSIDYAAGPIGAIIAKHISVEKIEIDNSSTQGLEQTQTEIDKVTQEITPQEETRKPVE